ncbi:hypothetical protein EV189_3334 [Motilibacter rhizosphaerae]|uniref:DUF6504 domain-containing protein n=1 Tax=Motilibacter rhizosphaerae TaxID=598652 RepID=A0A4Q7NHL3_9ACTN|nr:DUF6504 family protein [Motilibacter rhizosphaerae]RZS82936.1 hypothetical protein EV189_3334 [Motilibacter rhizosphaerae]
MPAAGAAVPEQFLWRGRLYLVRDVLSCWVETSPWWRSPAAELARGERVDALPAAAPAPAAPAAPAADPSAPAAPATPAERRAEPLAVEAETVTWRVEASPGRWAGSGVYDLRECGPGSWQLVQALD